MKIMKDRLEIFITIFPYISKYKIQWLLLFVLKVGQKIPLLLQPFILRAFIMYVIDRRRMSYIFNIIVMYIIIYIADTIFKVLHRLIDNSLFNNITKDLREILFEYYLDIPMAQFKLYDANDLIRRLNLDIDMVKFFLIGEVFDYIAAIVSILLSTILMFTLDFGMTIVAYLLIPFSILLSKRFEDKIKEISEQKRKITNQVEERVNKLSLSWKEVKANGLEAYLENDFSCVLQLYLKCTHENTKIQFNRTSVLATKKSIIDLFAIYITGGLLSLVYNLTAGTLIACVGYYNSILAALQEVMEADANLNWIKPSISRVIEILNSIDKNKANNIIHFKNHHIDYDVKDLYFKYQNSSKIILKNVSFKIKNGENLLIEGSSGSGKSTLVKLLSGELTQTSGKIYFKGEDLKTITERDLYKYVRIIDQNTYYMNISIRDFLRMARATNINDDEIRNVCIAVNLWKDIQGRPEGLDMLIGENGSKLSKGQKQKLALARLLLTKNKTIILDEALSAISAEDKILIINTLLAQYNEESVICITHDEELKTFFAKSLKM